MITKEAVLAYVREAAYRPLTAEELAEALGVAKKERPRFDQLLRRIEEDGFVVRTRRDRYGVPERMNLEVGLFQGHEKGFGFVLPLQGDGEDVFVSPKDMNGTMNGDKVVVRLLSKGKDGRRREGEVIRILHRANETVVGTLEVQRGFGIVVPDERRLPQNIVVAKGDLKGARDGEKVVVELTRWPDATHGPEGRVSERLGRKGRPGVDIVSIMRKYNLSPDFPPAVQREADRVPDSISEAELRGRWDLRETVTVTIDGADAKDLDDAVSLTAAEPPGRWRLGVHIADVSHYVREGSALDGEARDRGTSVYLVDRVVPMLPPRLSNGICSLNPKEDRLALTCFMDVDETGQIVGHSIGPSVIRSRARLTYDGVWQVLSGGKMPRGYKPLMPLLREMEALARRLRERRMERGSIDFDFPEPKVELDVKGRPVAIRRQEGNFAHRIIEEFMLAANETVAEHFFWRHIPFVYRVHAEPDEDRVEALEEFLFNFQIPFRKKKRVTPKEYQRVLRRVAGRPEESLISTILLRSMKQARYASDNLGHFGLAAPFYCHFTSPIRRYPDLFIHRVIRQAGAAGRLNPQRAEALREQLPDLTAHASQREREANDAEWETVKRKMVEFMAGQLGEIYDGVISGVTSFGFFVQLSNLVEGLVHVSNLTDDYYQHHEKRYALIGERTGRTFRLGDRVRVVVVKADPDEQNVDFLLAD